MATTTLHSIDRAIERCNLKNIRAAEKNIQRAYQYGKRAEDCTSWERSYLEKEAYNNCTAVAYNCYCYIFNEQQACVTVYSLPTWFGKRKHFVGKERIRNYKKYCKSNNLYGDHFNVC